MFFEIMVKIKENCMQKNILTSGLGIKAKTIINTKLSLEFTLKLFSDGKI